MGSKRINDDLIRKEKIMYIVIELQYTAQGQLSNMATAYNTIAEAWNKYYTILAYAAISEVKVHSAVILDHTGRCIAHNSFEHKNVE